MATSTEIKALFATGKVLEQTSFESLVDFLELQKGPRGNKGDKGDAGLGVKSIALTTDADGKITAGTLTFTNDTTAAITVEVAPAD